MRILLLIPSVRRLHAEREKWRTLALALWTNNAGRADHEADLRRTRRAANRWVDTQPIDPRRPPRREADLAPLREHHP